MRATLLKLEPIIWLLFGQGILLGTMLLTGWILVVGLLVPMGIVEASALSYERAYGLATSWILGILPIGKLLVAALIALPLWKGAHHVRSLLVDLGGGDRDVAVGILLYWIAGSASLMAIWVVIKL